MRKHVAPVAAKQGGCMKGSSSIKDKSSFLRGSLGLPLAKHSTLYQGYS